MVDNLNKLLPDLPPMSDDMRLDMHRNYVTPYLFYRKHSTEQLKLAYLLIYPLKSV